MMLYVLYILIGLLILTLVLAVLVALVRDTSVYLQALASEIPLTVVAICGLRCRGLPPQVIVDAAVELKHKGVACSCEELAALFLENRGANPSAGDLVRLKTSQM